MEKLIQMFNENNVRYLVIGGQAVRLLGMPRYSMDWDFYIPGKDIGNIQKINHLLSGILDMDLEPLGTAGQNFIQTFQTIYGIVQFHLAPVCLPPFDEAERRAVIVKSENGIDIKCLSPEDLYECKKSVNRPRDEADILFLEKKLNKRE
jgi:hypothetical protein